MVDNPMARYDRQEVIKDWNQEKIRNTGVCVLGSGVLSDFLIADLLSIGFGRVYRIGKSDLFDFEKINPEIYFESIDEEINNTYYGESIIPTVDLIADARIDRRLKSISEKIAKKRNIKYISAYATNSAFGYSSIDSLFQEEFEDKQGIVNSIICSGLVSDEIRKIIFKLNEDISLANFKYEGIKEKKSDLQILQVGAGAIGTFTGLIAALYKMPLTIVDFDSVEDSNLNRQFLFYESVGRKKAEVLYERLKKYSDKIRPVDERISAVINPGKHDAVFSCVDNNLARYWIDKSAKKHDKILINGGSSLMAGTAMVFSPEKTECLDCQLNGKLKEAKEEADNPKKRSSAECFNPSLIISNQIIAGLMFASLFNALDGNYKRYNYSSGAGIFDQQINTSCKCREDFI